MKDTSNKLPQIQSIKSHLNMLMQFTTIQSEKNKAISSLSVFGYYCIWLSWILAYKFPSKLFVKSNQLFSSNHLFNFCFNISISFFSWYFYLQGKNSWSYFVRTFSFVFSLYFGSTLVSSPLPITTFFTGLFSIASLAFLVG